MSELPTGILKDYSYNQIDCLQVINHIIQFHECQQKQQCFPTVMSNIEPLGEYYHLDIIKTIRDKAMTTI
jgi:hypothetical protein